MPSYGIWPTCYGVTGVLLRKPQLRDVVSGRELVVEGVVYPRRVEDGRQLSLERNERSVRHDLLVRLVPEAGSRRQGRGGLGLIDQGVNSWVVVTTPVRTGEADSTIEQRRN